MPRLLLWLIAVCAVAQPFPQSWFGELRWRMIGPFRGGRTPIAVGIPSQPNVYYIAANNGGVWKSNDYGNTWLPIFDDQPTGSIGALAIAPSNPNIIYVGSGEGLQRPDLSVGDGIYKSIDAGRTWEHLGLRDAQQISAILIDPRDANRVYVAALGHPYGANEERGVFRSTDGGRSWKKILYKDENTGACDLAFDPANPRKIYAVLWSARQAPWEASLTGRRSGLFVSDDGGDQWRPLTQGLPTPAQGLGRIGIAIAPSDARRMYALVEAPPAVGGLYRSDDAGGSWRRVNSEMRIYGRGADFAGVRSDPRNKDLVYVANTSTYRSINGGESFIAIKGAPGGDDYHSIWINPENPQIILLGCDQGATLSVNDGQTWSTWYNQPTAQFYHVITDHRFPYWVYGGQQESGSAAVQSRSDWGGITFREFHPVGVEEYGYVAPDPLDPNIIYGGKATRFNLTTHDTQDVSPEAVRSGKYRSVRTMPLLFSTVDPKVLFLGSNVLFKTVNGGHSWEVISPDLSRETYELPPSMGIYRSQDEVRRRGVIYAIAPSRKNLLTIWAGTDDGLIHVTRDGGRGWSNVTPPELTPWSKVSQLDASYFDNDTVYAAINRFRLDDVHPHIYRTHDGGKSWAKIVNGIPDNEVVNTVREDPVRKGMLFAGTERAVYVSFDDGDHWQSLRLNMPATSIRDLVIHEDDLVIGTHGRSFWIMDNITPLRQLSPQTGGAETVLFKPAAAYRVARNRNTDTPLPPEFPAGENPPDGATIDYFLKERVAGPVKLEVFDRAGKLVRGYSSDDRPEPPDRELNVPTYWIRPARILSAEPGMHRFVWDVRYAPPGALSHDYPISAVYLDTPRYPLGPWAMPGTYTFKLTVGSQVYSQPLTIKMDPRVKTPLTGLMQQFTLSHRVWSAMNDDCAAIVGIRALRAQLAERRARETGALVESLAALDRKAAEIEGGGAGGRAGRRGGGEGAPTMARLNGELAGLLGILEGSDGTPTMQAELAVGNLSRSVEGLLVRWREVQAKDVAALNVELEKAGLAAVGR
jgi:photosystem II stability/assembly factor-like uncharacterized protein